MLFGEGVWVILGKVEPKGSALFWERCVGYFLLFLLLGLLFLLLGLLFLLLDLLFLLLDLLCLFPPADELM